jgi:hypothetical protein
MKFRISGAFGELSEVREGTHNGIDIAMPEGTTLRSIADGIVYAIRDYGDKNIGKGVIIQTEDGHFHIFGHMSKITVDKGQTIHAGDVIGASGSTGHATGPHLHFGIQKPDGTFIDPTPYTERLTAMSGNINGDEFYLFGKPEEGSLMDKINEFSDWFIGKEIELIFAPMGAFLKGTAIAFWQWFIKVLPDLIGYSAIACGIFMILCAMTGKSGMLKPLGIFTGLFIVAVCILSSV